MHSFNASLHFDRALWKEDIAGSQAYARALGRAQLLSSEQVDSLVAGLASVAKEWEAGEFQEAPSDEDIHSANERRLAHYVGKDLAGRLHTGRSRNDQVATDMRLWLRNAVRADIVSLKAFLTVFADRAESELQHLMPGYTHLQVSCVALELCHHLMCNINCVGNADWLLDCSVGRAAKHRPHGI
jgi:argininosuccinate lyase